MNGLSLALFGCVNDLVNIQITLGRFGLTYIICLLGQSDVKRCAVHV